MKSETCVGLDEGKHLVQRSHGYAIAELAMAIPALLIIISMSVSLIGLTVTQLQLEIGIRQFLRHGHHNPMPLMRALNLFMKNQLFEPHSVPPDV